MQIPQETMLRSLSNSLEIETWAYPQRHLWTWISNFHFTAGWGDRCYKEGKILCWAYSIFIREEIKNREEVQKMNSWGSSSHRNLPVKSFRFRWFFLVFLQYPMWFLCFTWMICSRAASMEANLNSLPRSSHCILVSCQPVTNIRTIKLNFALMLHYKISFSFTSLFFDEI